MTSKVKSLYSIVCKIVLILQVIQGTVNIVCDGLRTPDIERPGKNLCGQDKQDVLCSNQVTSSSNFQNASCWIKYLVPDSSGCSDSVFQGKRHQAEKFGIVNLNPFLWGGVGTPFLYPNLNLTFTEINWKSLRFRFVEHRKGGTEFCREFNVSGDIDPSSVISYDCFWNRKFHGEFKFQYILTTKYGSEYLYTYLLKIPTYDNIETGKYIFMVLDETESPKISVKLQAPKTEFNVTHINITLYYKENLSSVAEFVIEKQVPNNVQEGQFISHERTVKRPGYYYFNASFHCDFCEDGVVESSSPVFKIKEQGVDLWVVIAGVILIILFITILFITVITIILKRRYKEVSTEQSPNVLFVYESCYPSHIEDVYKFKDFLEDYYFLSPKMDLVDISNTANGSSGDIWSWYYNELEMADYVFVFASPHKNTKKGLHEDNIYHGVRVFQYTITLLIGKALDKCGCKIVGIKLPGCSRFPKKVQAVISEEFTLPEKLASLERLLNICPLDNRGSMFTSLYEKPSRRQRCRPHPRSPLVFPVARPYDSDSDGEHMEPPPKIKWDGESLFSDESQEDDEVCDKMHMLHTFDYPARYLMLCQACNPDSGNV